MRNCFTVAIKHLNLYYQLPDGWKGYTLDVNNMDQYVIDQARFLARRDHIGFFSSFCDEVDRPEKNDIVLTRKSVGIAINKFAYWVYSEDTGQIEHEYYDKDCLIMRVRNG